MLYVHFRQSLVGTLRLTSSGYMQFAYAPNWLADTAAFPISVSMPLEETEISPTVSHNFFVNLLPEETVRQRICQALKISPGNDFELLKAIGGDCAGALSVTPDPEPRGIEQEYDKVAPSRLAAWSVGEPDVFSTVTGTRGVRLSLAGAQDKLPVHFRNGEVFIPRGNTPSSHLLKFPSPFYSHLPENETFVTWLARSVGLPTVDASLIKTSRARIAIIERYDRQPLDGGRYYGRLHQEDFCQALGIHPRNKYEQEGGPTLRQCAELIKRHGSIPAVEIQKLVDWMLFNLLVGNCDAHGKNLSLLFTADGHTALAPFYDLVCTRNYPRLNRHLAMKIGGESDPGLVGRKQLLGMAQELGVSSNRVMDRFRHLSDSIEQQLPLVVDQFRDQFGDDPVLERIPQRVRQQTRRTQTLMNHHE